MTESRMNADADPQLSNSLVGLMDGFSIRLIEGRVVFDRATPLRMLATATLRGLVGHLLYEHATSVAELYFKPGGNQPSACVFQRAHHRSTGGTQMPFRIVTWDPNQQLYNAILESFRGMFGRFFGESGARVLTVEMDEPEGLCFEQSVVPLAPAVVRMATPLMLKTGGVPLKAHELTLSVLARAIARRLNQLSDCYGNGRMIDPEAFARQAETMVERNRDIEWVAPRRRSLVQRASIALSGWVGWFAFEMLPPPLVDLLNTAACFHVGRHTNEGCGHVSLGTQ